MLRYGDIIFDKSNGRQPWTHTRLTQGEEAWLTEHLDWQRLSFSLLDWRGNASICICIHTVHPEALTSHNQIRSVHPALSLQVQQTDTDTVEFGMVSTTTKFGLHQLKTLSRSWHAPRTNALWTLVCGVCHIEDRGQIAFPLACCTRSKQ